MVQTRRNASVKDEINLPKVPAVTAKNIVTVDVHSKPMTVPLESRSIKSEIPVGNKMNVSRQCASLSRKSSSSIETRRKRLELQAAEAKARINMDLIEKRLAADIADLEDEKYSSHSEGNHSQHGNVEEWLERSQHELEAQADPRDGTDNNDGTVHILASALKDLAAASSSNNPNAQMLSRLCTPRDLPAYFGDPLEWLQFKQAFEESTRVCNFSDQENLWRLRKCLLGPAKDAVTALLISATSPTVVMSTLELQFGNPDIIISKIMYDIKKLPPVCPEYHKDIISFSIKVKNYVAAVLAIGQEEYLKGTNVTSIILSKLPTVLISKWADYSFKLIQEGMPLQITQGTPNGPYLTRTPLGWCVHGCVSTLQEGPHSMLFLSGSGVDGDSRESEKESLHDLHETVRQSFSIEAMGVSRKPRQNSEHVKAIEHLERTSMLKDGRWHVGLPWKDSSLTDFVRVIESCITFALVVFSYICTCVIRVCIVLNKLYNNSKAFDGRMTKQIYNAKVDGCRSLPSTSVRCLAAICPPVILRLSGRASTCWPSHGPTQAPQKSGPFLWPVVLKDIQYKNNIIISQVGLCSVVRRKSSQCLE
ncbi:hypothetical protein K1T71_005837, partial [Dendrolimus kikuchii]